MRLTAKFVATNGSHLKLKAAAFAGSIADHSFTLLPDHVVIIALMALGLVAQCMLLRLARPMTAAKV